MIEGKVVWLTGASTGIGKHLAGKLMKEASALALTARSVDSLELLSKELTDFNKPVLCLPGDVTKPEEMLNVTKQVENRVGPIDVLIANAGTYVPTDIAKFDLEEYRYITEVNFVGVLNCVQAVLPSMLERQSGYLVAVASLAGYRGLPRAAAYGASKAALIHFFESMSFDLQPSGIDVTLVNPGFVRTPLTDKNTFDMPFLMDPEPAADFSFDGLQERRREIHFPWKFSLIMKLLRVLPYPLYQLIIKKVVCR